MARDSSTARGWFSYQRDGITVTQERTQQGVQLVLREPPVEHDPARGDVGGQRLHLGPDGTVTGDVQAGVAGHERDGADRRVDGLLAHEPAGQQHLAPGRGLRGRVGQVHEVAQHVHLVGVGPGLTHLAGHELARADEHVDVAVRAQQGVDRGLQGHRPTGEDRAVAAPAQRGVPELVGDARLAHLVLVEEVVGGAGQLVVVQRQDDRERSGGPALRGSTATAGGTRCGGGRRRAGTARRPARCRRGPRSTTACDRPPWPCRPRRAAVTRSRSPTRTCRPAPCGCCPGGPSPRTPPS